MHTLYKASGRRRGIRSAIILAFVLLFCISCKKDTPPVTPDPGGDPAQYGAPYQKVPQTADIVMYEVNPGAFSSSGDLYGITARLDSIKKLGINTLWLMPIYTVGVYNSFGSPYCIKDYKQVNPSLGSLADLRTLVEQAHNREIAVILDWVANHTAWDNAWIKNKAWYTQDGSGNIISPAGTNWNDVADLNFDNAAMRAAMIKAMKYWVLAANIDGYRCDAADFVPFDFWQQAIDTLNSMNGRRLILLAEGARPDHFTAGFLMNYAWDFLGALRSVFVNKQPASLLFTANSTEHAGLPQGKRKLRFTTNHDESNINTPVTVFGGTQGALAASVAAVCLQGVPLLYCGQEVGVSNKLMYSSQRPVDWSLNPQLLASYRNLLNCYNKTAALRSGQLQTYADADVLFFTKSLAGNTVLVIINTRNKAVSYPVPAALSGTAWSNAIDNTAFPVADLLVLQPFQYLILEK